MSNAQNTVRNPHEMIRERLAELDHAGIGLAVTVRCLGNETIAQVFDKRNPDDVYLESHDLRDGPGFVWGKILRWLDSVEDDAVMDFDADHGY